MDAFTILVVDDEIDFLETIVNRLQKRKINAKGVLSGEEAVELMQKEPFDVVILDIKMPGGMDGIETLRKIKKMQPLAEVLLLTGHGALETSVEGIKMGAFDYLLKPIKLEALLAKIGNALEKINSKNHKNGKTVKEKHKGFTGNGFHQKQDQ